MSRTQIITLLLSSVSWLLALQPLPALGQPVCRPRLAVKETQFSAVQDQKRIWTALVTADASGCVETSGRFRLLIDRIIEYGPDLQFSEQFEWKAGTAEATIVFGYDEAPIYYWIADIAPCGCRTP